MAIEDGAVLGNILSRLSDISQLKPLLKAYEDLRIARTAQAQASSRMNQKSYHLPDGEEQRKRDEVLKKAMALEVAGETVELRRMPADQSVAAKKRNDDLLFTYDADAEVDKWWVSHGKDIEALAMSKLSRSTGSDAAFVCVACACVFLLVFFPKR
jgi:salicylate hydroxylase